MSILIVDTCALLDLVRAAARSEIHPRQTIAARDVLGHISASNAKHRVMVSEHVPREFAVHLQEVKEETLSTIKRLCDQWNHAVDVGKTQGEAISPISVANARGTVEAGVMLAQQLLASAAVIAPHPDDSTRAFARVVQRRTPARRGKDSTIDCAILEAALRVAKSETGPAFFLTSNTSDFRPNRRVPEDLDQDLVANGLGLACTWDEGWHRVQTGR